MCSYYKSLKLVQPHRPGSQLVVVSHVPTKPGPLKLQVVNLNKNLVIVVNRCKKLGLNTRIVNVHKNCIAKGFMWNWAAELVDKSVDRLLEHIVNRLLD